MSRPITKDFTFLEKPMRLYSLCWLYVLSNRDRQSLIRWDRQGVLPRPIFEDVDGKARWYCADELAHYSLIIKSEGNTQGRSLSSTGLKKKLHEAKSKIQPQVNSGNFTRLLPNEDSYRKHVLYACKLKAVRRLETKLQMKVENNT